MLNPIKRLRRLKTETAKVETTKTETAPEKPNAVIPAKADPNAPMATLEGAKIQQVDPETGEVLGDVTFEVISMEQKDRRIFYPEQAQSESSLKGVKLVDTALAEANVELKGKLTMVEYWSEPGLASGKYWNRMRELEQKHKDDSKYQFLSINWDDSLSKKAQVKAAQKQLKAYTQPTNLLFDIRDAFRENFTVSGPICYYLIDHRGQLLFQSRGDHPMMAEMDGHYENAVKNLKADLRKKKQSQIKIQ